MQLTTKVLKDHLIHKSEATILAKLNHPGVVKLLDCFEEDHRGYLVLEFVEGTPIHDLVSMHGAFSEAEGSRNCHFTVPSYELYALFLPSNNSWRYHSRKSNTKRRWLSLRY
jgi:serine/threonine protein kinase